MGGTNGEADLGLSTAYLPLPRFNAPRERSKARRRLDGGSAASGDAGTAVMPRSSAGVAAAQPSAAQPPDHRKRKRDEASEDKADALFMMVLRKKYPKYVGRCMQEKVMLAARELKGVPPRELGIPTGCYSFKQGMTRKDACVSRTRNWFSTIRYIISHITPHPFFTFSDNFKQNSLQYFS